MRSTALAAIAAAGCVAGQPEPEPPLGALPTAVTTAEPLWVPFRIAAGKSVDADPRERHFAELRQLTFDGTAGIASWHPDGRSLVFESGRSATSCGSVHRYDLRTGQIERLVDGAAGGGAVLSDGTTVVALGAAAEGACSSIADLRWAPADGDLALIAGGAAPRPIAAAPGWDGEAAVSIDGRRLALVSSREGDPEVYVAAADGSALARITHAPGYDGAPVFSPDGSRLAWHAERMKGELPASLGRGPFIPRALRVVVAGADGQHPTILPELGRYDMSPTFLPDSRRLLVASDLDDAPGAIAPAPPPPPPPEPATTASAGTAAPATPPPPPAPPAAPEKRRRNFELYVVDPDAPAPASGGIRFVRITFHEAFDAWPRFSPDGRWLVFLSTRNATEPGGVNLFAARWRDD
jgi:Tol biopolymer transport system component